MKEARGNLWNFDGHKVITTNGFVKKNGSCVMGKGCAKEAAQRYPSLPLELGSRIKEKGNLVFYFGKYDLFTFPVKHNWWEKADLALIEKSAIRLVKFSRVLSGQFIVPRPGCGNGGLEWETVEPILRDIFTNQFTVVTL